VYATSQPHRILVAFAVDGSAVGDDDSAVTADGPREVAFRVAGTAPLDRVTVVKNNEDWHVVHGTADPGAGLSTYTLADDVTDDDPVTGMRWDDERGSDADVYYLRVEQADDGMAWAGPVWAEPAE
jgi:hypothetical protein